jgi:hypothetical protein
MAVSVVIGLCGCRVQARKGHYKEAGRNMGNITAALRIGND